MVLVIDIGNSNITFACMDEISAETIIEERIHTDFKKTSIEYAIEIKNILDIHNINPRLINGGIVSSSAPPVTRQVKNAAEIIIGKSILEVAPGIKTGVDIKIDDPASLGADLLVGAVAGLSEYGAPLVLIDMGTATTISVISAQKRFIGGLIIPGIMVALNGLTSHASHLPNIAISTPAKLINGSTVGAMLSGSIYGHAASIDGLIERIWDELGYKTPVVATGGFAKTVIPCCKNNIIIDSQLLMKGLLILYNKNIKNNFS